MNYFIIVDGQLVDVPTCDNCHRAICRGHGPLEGGLCSDCASEADCVRIVTIVAPLLNPEDLMEGGAE